MTGEVRVARQGWAGRITLDRPRSLNGLTGAMVQTIGAAIAEFAAAPSVALIIIDSASPRAFSAGGDIEPVYRKALSGNLKGALAHCRTEYELDAAISACRKPVVTLVDGLVMGGGIGIAAHASHPIVTERIGLSLPECQIGWVPDSGTTAILARAPGCLGEYLALTGARIGAADAIHAGFAAHYVPSARLPALVEALTASGDADAVKDYAAIPPSPHLACIAPEIDAVFGRNDLAEIVEALEPASGGGWQTQALAALRRASPVSLLITLALVRHVRASPELAFALQAELSAVAHVMEDGDFFEGVRAAIIDRDRKPKWKWPRIEDLPAYAPAPFIAGSMSDSSTERRLIRQRT